MKRSGFTYQQIVFALLQEAAEIMKDLAAAQMGP